MHTPDYTSKLRSLLQQADIPSLAALIRLSGVSERQINQLRRGNIGQMQVATLQKLSATLKLPLVNLIAEFSKPGSDHTSIETDGTETDGTDVEVSQLKQEYERLQKQLEEKKAQLLQEFKQSTLQTLESLLLQLPTAAHAAQQNPDIPASRLIPLLKPIDQLLKEWEIESIAPVGAEVLYDPQQHQLMNGTAEPGASVRVRYTGYMWGDRLLYRAKVSPVINFSADFS